MRAHRTAHIGIVRPPAVNRQFFNVPFVRWSTSPIQYRTTRWSDGPSVAGVKTFRMVCAQCPAASSTRISGNGTIRSCRRALASETGIKLQHVPYRGAGRSPGSVAGQSSSAWSLTSPQTTSRPERCGPRRRRPRHACRLCADYRHGRARYEIEGWFAAIGRRICPQRKWSPNPRSGSACRPKTRDTLISQATRLHRVPAQAKQSSAIRSRLCAL